METLSAPKETILEHYKQGDSTLRSSFITLFGRQHFFFSMQEWEAYIIPLVQTLEDACRLMGEDPLAEKFTTGEPDEISYKQGKVVVAALNGDWVRNWNDSSQLKYEAWLKWGGSGFRFYGSDCGRTLTYSTGGARLRLCSAAIAKHFAVQFESMMQPFWI